MIDKLITLPNKHLRQRSKKIGVINEKTLSIIQDMKEVTIEWENSREHEVGVALAAIQIDVNLRIVIIREDTEHKENQNFIVFINPEITKLEGELLEDYEGCLSIKDIYGKVPRYSKARIKALDENGKVIRVKAEGFLARIFQHEIDHTNGKLFIDHIKNKEDAFYRLDIDGKLVSLDYETDIRNNSILW